jgi:hypothetical protein
MIQGRFFDASIISTLKPFLWVVIVVLLAMSFPAQVALFSPLPSLFPYIGLVLLFVLALPAAARPNEPPGWNLKAPMNLIVSAYVALVCVQTGWQTLFGFVTIEQGVSAIVIYVLPVAFYAYFRQFATDREIRVVLATVAVVGVVVGWYFVYDAYTTLVLNQLNDFAVNAHEYSKFRANTPTVNAARLSAGGRSHGLLELHAVSAAWVAVGCFAALALTRSGDVWQRAMVIVIYGIMLLIALNFTAVVGFALVILLIEFQSFRWFTGRIEKSGLKVMAICLGSAVVMVLFIAVIGGIDLFQVIGKIAAYQVDLALGNELISENGYSHSYFGKLLSSLFSYPFNMLAFPPGLVIGDGLTSGFGVIQKGGDFGVVETLHRLGLPLFVVVVAGLIRLVFRALRELRFSKAADRPREHYLRFAVCVTVYLLFTEIHYTVWSAKSIFPIFLIALALYSRCLTFRHGAQESPVYSGSEQVVPPA